MPLVLLLLTFCLRLCATEIGPALRQAHAHNDYEHGQPLLEALSHGFTSVEADVYLVKGELLVGHDPEDLHPQRTLRGLYLDPLKELAGGRKSIFGSGETLTLLIDFKSEGEATYAVLRKLLEDYRSMLTRFDSGQMKTNAVTVIISGNRPRETLLAEKARLAAFDGRLEDLGKSLPFDFMPLVSDNWNSHFKWRGVGEFAAEEREKLKSLVSQAHAEKRRIRFWASPDVEAGWRELQKAGVDLINTDKLDGLAAFLRDARSASE
jgi:glycerophosphoryl diester phosphodiesterase